jgi:hypothetical protein
MSDALTFLEARQRAERAQTNLTRLTRFWREGDEWRAVYETRKRLTPEEIPPASEFPSNAPAGARERLLAAARAGDLYATLSEDEVLVGRVQAPS